MLSTRLRKNLDFSLIILTYLVVGMGLTTIFSATHGTTGRFLQKQVFAMCLGTVGLIAAALTDYAKIARYAKPMYVANLGMLFLVFRLAQKTKGSQRWINLGMFQMQPSEFAKIILIFCLAAYIVNRIETIRETGTIVGTFLYIVPPMVLILKQPDLGTSLVLIAVWLGMTYIAGASVRHLAIFVAAGALLFAVLWHFKLGIKDYQRNRIETLWNPEADPGGAGYQVRQSQIAVGSGQVFGRGFRRGTQAQGRFIPENHTDFIYTVVGEEGGFVQSSLLVFLYGGILVRGAVIMAQSEEILGKLIATGIVTMYAFHVIVNIGMTIGIMPVTGVPLPLFSYGGSNLLLNMTSIGVLLGIGMRKHRLVF